MADLDVMVENILDAIADALSAAAEETGGGLDAVASIVRGDRARPMPELPAVWVVPQPAVCEGIDYGTDETWYVDVSIATLVKGDDPEEAARLSRELTARARRVALTIRHSLDGLVDVTSRSFDPHARSSETNTNLHWTDATVRVAFTVTDE